MVTRDEYEAATAEGRRMLATTPQNEVCALSSEVYERHAKVGTLFSEETAEVI